jgi:hypothetical protein
MVRKMVKFELTSQLAAEDLFPMRSRIPRTGQAAHRDGNEARRFSWLLRSLAAYEHAILWAFRTTGL